MKFKDYYIKKDTHGVFSVWDKDPDEDSSATILSNRHPNIRSAKWFINSHHYGIGKRKIKEDAPMNSTAGVAGLTGDPPGGKHTLNRLLRRKPVKTNLKKIKKILRKESFLKEEMESLYVYRDLVNVEDFVTWAKQQGFQTTIDDFHVTCAFSKEPVDWARIELDDHPVIVSGDFRTVEKLGPKGAVVLKLQSEKLQDRFHYFMGIGSSWDWPEYQPHVTITYSGPKDISGMEPYNGLLVFGAENAKPINMDKINNLPKEKTA